MGDEGAELTGFEGDGTGEGGEVFWEGLGLMGSTEGENQLEGFVTIHGWRVQRTEKKVIRRVSDVDWDDEHFVSRSRYKPKT